MNKLDKETFSFWVTHPEELLPIDIQPLQEAMTAFPYCQSLYLLAAKATSIHQKSHAIEYIRQAAAHALSRNALRKLIENEFQWSENLLSRLNELSLKHVPIPDDYKKESYELFKRKAEQNQNVFSNPIFDFAKSVSFDAITTDEQQAEVAEAINDEPEKSLPIIDEVLQVENVIQTTLEKQETVAKETETAPADPERNLQLQLIDDFIKREPSIQRPRMHSSEQAEQEDLTRRTPLNTGVPVTEAFAKILARQGKPDRAIDIYMKLMLKNPEKKVYFAEKIAALKAARDQ
ncbi:hypothetical protein LX87_05152 [Larkinella arboricola]|uniref:Tetratricopeptide repeat protein n=1 Tax=Larkinella arboricola TaxID=643671 RepID=A0A327WLM5_LARAB|nr:hypothetical protein [Larkinella arboricola]RAJ92185.1 hypothetical protein LX87_05152 [Larkinella arboricola]